MLEKRGKRKAPESIAVVYQILNERYLPFIAGLVSKSVLTLKAFSVVVSNRHCMFEGKASRVHLVFVGLRNDFQKLVEAWKLILRRGEVVDIHVLNKRHVWRLQVKRAHQKLL